MATAARVITQAMQASNLIPTPHWQPRCDVCRLRKTNPEAYNWSTFALLDGTLTQEEIAAEMLSRWGIALTQPQLSNHKTKHLDPSLSDAFETFLGHSMMLEALGDMPPEQMAVVYAQIALIEMGQKLKSVGNKEAAGVASAMASLSKAIQTGVKIPAELQSLVQSVRKTELETAVAAGNYEEGLFQHFKQFYPDLLPLLEARASQAQPALPETSDG